MAVRPEAPQRGNTLTAGAVLTLAGLVSAPATAFPGHEVLSDGSREATLEVSASELTATPVNTSDELLRDHQLKPRVDATAREVFDEDDAEFADEADEADDGGSDETDAAIRGLSDSKAPPLQRQMYRRDI
ncbi:MAG: hypothetical protein MJA32_14315 [Proteobacteria bacterium]|nr:hypothetical protein [Pseudomonadota bacterium]